MPFVVTLPTFAVTAAYHGRVDSGGRTVPEIFDEAAKFARTDYIGALIQGDALPDAEKARIAQELSKRIGLTAEFIASKNLRISKPDFMMNLLKDKGVRTGQLDGRATGDFATYANRQPPYDDPSMGGSAQEARQSTGSAASPQAPPSARTSALQTYFTSELKFPTTETYRGLNLDINAKWKFDVEGAMSDPVGRIAAAMKEQPRLRVFWAGGYYDITTPLYAGKYVLDQSGIPPERLTVASFPTGHSVFEGDDNLARFTEAVRQFVRGGTTR
jgi:carboxypeptidase C (cathepsin A)